MSTAALAPSQCASIATVSPSTARTATQAGSSLARNRSATTSPAASWRAWRLPMPITTTPPAASAAVDLQLEEVRRAGDARIVVADRLLAAQPQLVVGQVDVRFDDRPQVLLDRELVLGGRRD